MEYTSVELTPTATTHLDPSTTYVIVTANDFGFSTWHPTALNGENTHSTGGSIADTSEVYQSGTMQWGTSQEARKITVRGSAIDTPPTLSSAAVLSQGAHIQFQFSETMDRSNLPPVSAFAVTVGGAARTVSSVILGTFGILIGITPTILQGETVVVTYTDPTSGNDANAFQDAAGNDVATFTTAVTNNSTLTNHPATGAPTITGTMEVGQTLTANRGTIADADGLPATFPAGYSFQWRGGQAGNALISGATSSTYRLVPADLGHRITVRVSFTDGANNTETRTGARPLTETVVADATPPTLSSARVPGNGSRIELVFSETVQASNLPTVSAFTVTAGGNTRTVTGIDRSSGRQDTMQVSISPAIPRNETVVVTYTDPSGGNDANALQDTAGNDVATFTTGQNTVPAVTNSSYVRIPNMTATVHEPFTYTVPTNAFADTRVGDTFSAVLNGPGAFDQPVWWNLIKPNERNKLQPGWLRFDPSTRTFSGSPLPGSNGNWSITVHKRRPGRNPVDTVTFDITVRVGDAGLVSNFSNPGTAGRNLVWFDHAQKFTTGGASNGYAVTSVDLSLNLVGSTGNFPTVRIRNGSANAPNGSTIATLTPPSRAESRHKTYRYTAPTGTTLAANTTFWLVVTGGSSRVYTTGWTALDAGSASGWAIDSITYRRMAAFRSGPAGSWSRATTGSPTGVATSMRINGAVASMQQAVDPPTITGTPVLSGAGEDGTWSESETVRVALTFSESVDVDTSAGTPSLGIELGVGGSARSAAYESGSGTATLTFAYTLVADDGDHTSMAVTPDSLALNGGTIRSSETAFDALLGHLGAAAMGGGGSGGSRNSPEVAFHDVPESHDGETPFTLTVAFGGAPDGLSPKRDAGSTLEVEGGAITKSRQAPGQSAGTWELTVTPSGTGGVTVRVPARPCAEAHAVCIDGRALPEAVEVTIAGTQETDDEMTARVTAASASHDGSTAFEMDFEFSHAPRELSYRTIRDDFFDVTGGRIANASRLIRGDDQGWRLVVQPGGDGAVTVDARATSDCEAAYAVCDAEGRMFNGGLAHTVPGPAPEPDSETLPVVSIAAGATPVNEGTDLSFTLSRTGSTDDALTVNVTVSESGDVLDESPPASVTFAAGAATATLSVATVDDETEEDTSTVTATLAAGSGYAVDADAGAAEGEVESDDLAPITARFTKMVDEHDGSGTFLLRFAFSHEPAEYSYKTVHNHLFDVTGGAIERARRLVKGSNLGWELRVAPAGFGEVTLSARATTDCAAAHAACDAAGRMFDGNLRTTIQGPPTLSVADATVEEAEGATLDFAVTLSRALPETVTVGYATSNGSATAGSDYTGTSGRLTFAAHETAKTVSVPVLDDAHDEGTETVGFTLSNPSPARVKLADASAEGSITNDDRMPQAWIARFGRTVAEQAIEAVEGRFTAPRAAGLSGSIAGQSLGGSAVEADPEGGVETLSDWLAGEEAREPESRTLTGRDLLTGSSFAMTGGSAQAGVASFWGRGAVTRFDGREGEMTLDGEVSSAMLGADFSRDALVAGLMLSHARGEGGYRSPAGDGEVESTLTALFPYGRIEASERLSLWGMAGYGEGTLTLTPDGAAPLRPDLSFLMGAVGARGVLAGEDGGSVLALKSDAMAARTRTDAVSGSDGGNLAAAEGQVTRLRLALEGSHPVRLGASAVLTPSLELGVRHDGGDAETGFGADIGAGLALSDPARGLTADIRARGLLTHEAGGFGERGLSGTLSFDPAPGTERGLSVNLTQTVGGPSWGGADALLGRTTLAGLGAEDGGGLDARRLDARIGYGYGVFEDRYTAIPELGLGLGNAGRELRLGWRLAERVSAGLAFELGVEGTRREPIGGETGPDHGLGLGFGWRLVGAGTQSFNVRVEAARLDVANDDAAPEDRIGIRVGAGW